MSDKHYGPHLLSRADREMPFNNNIVFATNQGWCVPNKEMHNNTELVIENHGLLDRLKDAGYDKFGIALQGNPYGDLPRPRPVAQYIREHLDLGEPEEPVVEDTQPTVEPVEPEADTNAEPEVEDEPESVVETEVVEDETTTPIEDAPAEETEVEPEPEAEVEVEEEEPQEEKVKYTVEQLMDMNMKDVRRIGRGYGVKDNDKEELANKIVAAQDA